MSYQPLINKYLMIKKEQMYISPKTPIVLPNISKANKKHPLRDKWYVDRVNTGKTVKQEKIICIRCLSAPKLSIKPPPLALIALLYVPSQIKQSRPYYSYIECHAFYVPGHIPFKNQSLVPFKMTIIF